jgi:hypothetical protein
LRFACLFRGSRRKLLLLTRGGFNTSSTVITKEQG